MSALSLLSVISPRIVVDPMRNFNPLTPMYESHLCVHIHLLEGFQDGIETPLSPSLKVSTPVKITTTQTALPCIEAPILKRLEVAAGLTICAALLSSSSHTLLWWPCHPLLKWEVCLCSKNCCIHDLEIHISSSMCKQSLLQAQPMSAQWKYYRCVLS